MLRYAGGAVVLAFIAGGIAYLSQSSIVSFLALLAMNLGLVLTVAFIILGVGSYRAPSDPPFRAPLQSLAEQLSFRRGWRNGRGRGNGRP